MSEDQKLTFHREAPAETGIAQDKLASYYHSGYHAEHYGQVLDDQRNYDLLSQYWRYVLFTRNGLDADARILDFGSGIGQVSAALPNSVCFDFSRFATQELQRRKRRAVESRDDIPLDEFEYVLSSHALEHSPTPYQDLLEFRRFVHDGGMLLLVLPIELDLKPALEGDWNQHLQAWTFQTITNLLLQTGWRPVSQSLICGPYGLRALGRRISMDRAVRCAHMLGKLRRQGRSMLTIARSA